MLKSKLMDSSKPENQTVFFQQQKEHFIEAELQRYHWQTSNPFIKQQETWLLTSLAELLHEQDLVLEVGAGEGANLVNLNTGNKNCSVVAVDFSAKKSAVCWQNVQNIANGLSCAALCADASRLPFDDKSFNLVYCRDLLHHIPPGLQAQVVAEMFRVCKPGGQVLLIESNGRNPIIFLHAMLIKAERGELKSSPALFKKLMLQAGAINITIGEKEPLPFFRLLLHYRFGFPQMGTKKLVVKIINFLNRLFGFVIPKSFWAYIVIKAQVPG